MFHVLFPSSVLMTEWYLQRYILYYTCTLRKWLDFPVQEGPLNLATVNIMRRLF